MDSVKKIARAIKNLTAADFYKIYIEPDAKPAIFDSKFGGTPYWTADKAFPVDANGNKMFLLAQINFAAFKFDEPFPSGGILQFFAANEDLLGLDYDNPTAQKNFRVVYHEKIGGDIVEIPPDNPADNFTPVCGEYKISFSRSETFMTAHDFRFDEICKSAAGGVELSDENYQKLCSELEPKFPCHQMLGYPYFTQEDPRYNKKFAEYDTLLLQIDSEGEYVMWGDAGVGNFFIRRQDLVDKNFSDVLYNWDCC